MAKRQRVKPKKRPPLFNRPMNELRKAFVRARFAEMQCFGRTDIEAWLQQQRETERPEYDHDTDTSLWNAVLSSDHIIFAAQKQELEQLTTLATPLVETPEGFGVERHSNVYLVRLQTFLAMLDRRCTTVYYGHACKLIVVYRDGTLTRVFVCEADPINDQAVLLTRLDSNYVVDAVFAEWLYGRPKWRRARQFLCDALAKDIERERLGAETDFDLAVATSKDGVEIVHADFVVTSTRVLGADDKLLAMEEVLRIDAADLYPDHRVLLCARSQRGRGCVSASSIDYAVALGTILNACASRDAPRQYIAEMADGKKILVTHPDLVPDLNERLTPPQR